MKILKLGDKVTLNGHEGIVTLSEMSRFYISDGVLNINHKFLAGDRGEALVFCRSVLGYQNEGGFPECNTLEELTKLVNALIEREKSAEECVTERVKTANTITTPLYTWKNITLKGMWADYNHKSTLEFDDLFHRESVIGERLTKLDVFDALTEEVQEITIDGIEYYIRKSDVDGLNLITNE